MAGVRKMRGREWDTITSTLADGIVAREVRAGVVIKVRLGGWVVVGGGRGLVGRRMEWMLEAGYARERCQDQFALMG